MEKSESEQWKLPLYKIYSDDEDLQIITKVVRRGTNWAQGPEIEELENLIKNYVNTEYCLVLNSGTSALHATYLAYDLGKGDKVIVPSFSFISTANSVLFVDALPKFADIEEESFGLDPEKLDKIIDSTTKAIVPMDYGGQSCKILEIKEIAHKRGLKLIEDAAESLGTKVNGKKVGSIADATIFSFCGNKVLTTGEGGAVVTNSKEIFEKIKLIRSHGRVENGNYFTTTHNPRYAELGYNWRMSSITAALGISQLNKLDRIIKMRQDNASYLNSRLSKYEQISLPKAPSNSTHIYQMYSILLKDEKTRDGLQEHLKKKKIISKIYFMPIHQSDFYKGKYGMHDGMLPVTERISKRILTLPLYPNMSSEERDYLIDSVSEFFDS